MKKQIFTATLILGAIVFGTINAQAQDATTTVNITLADVLSIDAGSAAINGAVDFNYLTAEEYNQSQIVNVPNSLIVTSTTSFDIDVKADGPTFAFGAETIPVDVLTIKPVIGGTTTMTGASENVILSIADQKLISGADLGSAVVLELEYEIPAEKSSSTDILGKPAGAYTQTVTYTATAI